MSVARASATCSIIRTGNYFCARRTPGSASISAFSDEGPGSLAGSGTRRPIRAQSTRRYPATAETCTWQRLPTESSMNSRSARTARSPGSGRHRLPGGYRPRMVAGSDQQTGVRGGGGRFRRRPFCERAPSSWRSRRIGELNNVEGTQVLSASDFPVLRVAKDVLDTVYSSVVSAGVSS